MNHDIDAGAVDELLIEMRYQEWRARSEMEVVIADGSLSQASAVVDPLEAMAVIPIASAA